MSGGAIALFILSAIFYKKIVALFATVVLSKVISVVLCVAAVVISLIAMPDYMVMIEEGRTVIGASDPDAGWKTFLMIHPVIVVLLAAFGWLFYSGARIFDVEYDGSFRLYDVGDGYVPVPKQTGGFFGNLGFAIVIISIFWFVGANLSGGDMAIMSFVPTIGIIILDAIALIKAWRERDEY